MTPKEALGPGGWGLGQIEFSLETLRTLVGPILSGSGVVPTTHRDLLVDIEEGSVHLVALRAGMGLCGEREHMERDSRAEGVMGEGQQRSS